MCSAKFECVRIQCMSSLRIFIMNNRKANTQYRHEKSVATVKASLMPWSSAVCFSVFNDKTCKKAFTNSKNVVIGSGYKIAQKYFYMVPLRSLCFSMKSWTSWCIFTVTAVFSTRCPQAAYR